MSTDVYFSTTPTDWTAVEGLYVALQKQEGQISGANVNTVGLFDTCVRGPTTPQVIASQGDFLALYGGRDNGGGGAITGNVWKAMLNRKFAYPMVVCRVTASAAAAAHVHLSDAAPAEIITVTATSSGTWANGATGYGITVAVTAASDGDANKFNLVVKYLGTVTTYKNLDVHATGTDNTTTVIGTSDTNLITVTKQADGRPINTVSDQSLAGGTDGTVAAADYEAAFDKIAAYPGVRIVPIGCAVMVDESTHNTIDTYVETNASKYPLITFTMWAGANHSRADEITQKGTTLATGARNIVWCYNASSTLDSTSTYVETGPHLDAAVILANRDVAVHLGDEDNVELLSGVKKVYNDALTRADLVLLRAAGISTLEHVDNGFKFHTAVCSTSKGAIGDDTAVELADERRRMWMVESITKTLRHDIAKAGTATRDRSIIGKVVSFLAEDQVAEHVVAPDDETLGPAWYVGFVETPAEKARNIRKLLTKVRLLPYNLTIVMITDIGTGVTVVKTQ